MESGHLDRLILDVPNLPERPYVGSTCCVVPAEGLIADELGSWPQVREVKVDVARGRVELDLQGDPPRLDYLLDALADLGYPASVVDEGRDV